MSDLLPESRVAFKILFFGFLVHIYLPSYKILSSQLSLFTVMNIQTATQRPLGNMYMKKLYEMNQPVKGVASQDMKKRRMSTEKFDPATPRKKMLIPTTLTKSLCIETEEQNLHFVM